MRTLIDRRSFLKTSAALAVSAAAGRYLNRNAYGASRDRVTIYHSSVADSINPYNHSSSPIYGNWQHVMEPLVELDYKKQDYVGILADSWQFQGNKWTFKLKKGIKFHNGAPLTSKDVAFSIEKMRDEKGGSLQAPNFKDVTEVQTPDDLTVVFVTKQPLAIFLDRLENRFILSKVAGDKYGDKLYDNPIGTGPYKFVSYQRGGNMVFTRNDEYWGGKAAIKEIVFRKVTEDAARLAALESGQADFINNVPDHEVARLQKHPRIRIDKIEGLRMFFLAFNTSFKPWDNKLVRQAANYSVDAAAIVKNIFDGIGYPINGPVGRNVIGADPKLKRYPYDPQKSKELLTKAGFPNGCDIQLYYSAGRYPKDREVCQVVAAQMVKGGFRVELVSQEWALFWDKQGVNGGKLPFYYIGRGSLTDADTLYDQYFRTGTTKRTNYSNPDIDKLIEEQQKTADQKKRIAILQKAGKMIMEEAPFIPLYNLADIYGVARNLVWKMRPDEKVLGWDMSIK
ncbi:MAG TPA: ABC transporter substrate-binding protein [Candidatus Eisenbacteria bacterium]|jgi:peptide/nickel transport system substrate-binding protein|nr:ABC transporter substrate-binding protein [Candidatus Eisenbacteria bacterium]